MKKILATVLGVVFAMFAFAGCNMAAADGTATGASGITSIVMMVVIIAVFYFLMIVPEKKRKKKAQEMRDSIEVGDKIVTIGGMVGKVVHVTWRQAHLAHPSGEQEEEGSGRTAQQPEDRR